MARDLIVFIAGNPNSGKTTLFNAITGLRQQTGNYPGVTVDRKEGRRIVDGHHIRIVDLPGTYNLTSYSAEEKVARDALLSGSPDVVINVIDATNLERNLFLTVQLLEMGIPVVLALNMSDELERKGMVIDRELLSRNLNIPVVLTVGHRSEGIEELLKQSLALALRAQRPAPLEIRYGKELDPGIDSVVSLLQSSTTRPLPAPARWLALKCIEGDEDIVKGLRGILTEPDKAMDTADAVRNRAESLLKDGIEVIVAEQRYGHISGAAHPAVRYTVEARHSQSDRIDDVLTHSLFGLPIFLLLMYGLFWATFALGEYPMSWLESLFGFVGQTIAAAWSPEYAPLLRSLVIDGAIAGVGGVLVFLPNIMILFAGISILEDTGYMSRAAYLTDRVMRTMGMQGKSFIPMLVGFGCTVPAVMAARTLDSRRDRLITVLVLPLVSCGARLPVYALLIPAFFPSSWQGPMLWMVYLFGIVMAVLIARLLRGTVFRGEDTPFVMELPPYRMPTLKAIALHSWERSKEYLKKAGTVILAISIVIWFLGNFPRPDASELAGKSEAEISAVVLENSVLAKVGRAMETVTAPLGFDWRINTALFGAMAAKEVFVAQTGVVFALGEVDEESVTLREKLRNNYSTTTGLALLLFLLIATPCVATVAVVRKETGSWGMAIGQWIGLTLLGYGVATVVALIGGIFGG